MQSHTHGFWVARSGIEAESTSSQFGRAFLKDEPSSKHKPMPAEVTQPLIVITPVQNPMGRNRLTPVTA